MYYAWKFRSYSLLILGNGLFGALSTSKLLPDTKCGDMADNLNFAVALARIESHYFINGIFLEEAFILKNVDKIKDVPVDIVQGRYDVVCPATSAWELHQALPHR